MNEGRGEPMYIDERQAAEIRHALYYAQHCNHGSVGHNVLLLLAQFARAMGFHLAPDNHTLLLRRDPELATLRVPPEHVTIVENVARPQPAPPEA